MTFKKIILIFIILVAGILSLKFFNLEKKKLSREIHMDLQNSKLLSKYINMELDFKKSAKNILIGKMKEEDISNNKTLERYNLVNGFYLGMNNYFPGSGYIDFHEDNLFVLSSRGIIGYTKDLANQLSFKQIKNNIDNYINYNQYKKNNSFSLKDLLISNDKIFVSFSEEIKKNCWNTSILIANMNYKNINFSKLFSTNECVHSEDNEDGEFHSHEAGGRIVAIDNDHVVLTTGPYRSRFLSQDKKSINGKLIKININNSDYEIISMGHRNPQGLYFDEENNFLLETEHGPQGGDEINIIEINKDEIQNFGWAMVSAGEHYGGKIERNKEKYLKYPLYKSHSEHGFIEPLKSFVPSIGISEITKIENTKYVVISLKDKSLYFFELKNKKILSMNRVEVFERVRDLKYKNNKLYLFLEDTPSIGIINLELNVTLKN